MERRSFLQMLGAAAASLCSGSVLASPSPNLVPLFAGKDSSIWTPEHAKLTGGHLVLVPRRATPSLTFGPQSGFGLVRGTATDLRHDWPIVGGHTLHLLDPLDTEEEVANIRAVARDENEDLHLVFYRAAMKLRSSFSEQAARQLQRAERDPWTPPPCMLVTLVDTPIFAGALESAGELENGAWSSRERGFYAEISYTRHVVPASNQLKLNGWDLYSENGEYPIEVPSNIDLERLLAIDENRKEFWRDEFESSLHKFRTSKTT
jgi:hypothetical protein